MKRSAPLKRRTPLRPRRKKAEVRVGKVTGKVRLSGKAIKDLRFRCWIRDMCCCVDCGTVTHFDPWFDGDPKAFDMAHIRGRGASGSDELSNVVTKCHRCHMKEHAGRGKQEEAA